MYLRRKLEAMIAGQQKKIADLERQIAEGKAYLSGLQDSIKLLPQEGGSPDSEAVLREGSALAKARDILRKAGKPLHVEDILKHMGKEVNRNNKGGLGGSIGSYARKGLIFTRPAPNTFGLAEFDSETSSEQPPEDFGTTALTQPPEPKKD